MKALAFLKRQTARVLALALLLTFAGNVQPSRAAVVTSLTDTMSRLKVGTLSNHEIKFVTPTGIAASAVVSLTFTGASSNAFAIEALFDYTDADIAVGDTNNCATATFTERVLAASLSATDSTLARVSATVLTLTARTGSAFAVADKCVRFRLGTNAVSGVTGDKQITNPASAATNAAPTKITIDGDFGDTGSLAVGIITDDQVTITATVDPLLTFALSATTCSLGTLVYNVVAGCSYTVTTTTNAPSGYTTSITDNNAGSQTTLLHTDTTTTIPDVSGTLDLGAGVSEYGVATSDSGGSVTVGTQSAGTCVSGPSAVATALTTSAQVVAENTAAVSAEATTICHKAIITNTQKPGSYSDSVTLISTGNF